MIKVIEVSSDTNIGGAGKCLITLLENFDYTRYDVSVVLPKNSLLKEHIEKLGIRVTEIDGMADKSLDMGAVWKLKRVFDAQKPDIVHTHGSMSARIAGRLSGAKVVYTRHSVFPPSPKISKGVGKVINGMVNNSLADGIIAVAEAAKDNLTDTGINPKKIRVILNGVDGLKEVSESEKDDIRKRFGIIDEKVVSIVARLEDIKGHKYFIEAADTVLKKGVNAKFFIAGTGSYEGELKKFVKALKRDKDIIFTGFIKDVDKLMSITNVQVNASYGTEATSLALLEGMSIGIPAVVSDFGGNPGVIKDGVNGFIFPQKNAKALSEKLLKVLSDDDVYQTLSRGAREVFKTTFTAKAMTENTQDLYDDVMGGLI
ncbi:MAG: glycosyltransferase family 4 protein [Clostridia bacterium]|nr:glycosyltransferase family 4 protein [Clostridia bacterium]